MVGMDNSSPPVLFVVGTAGAGKSSLVTSFQRWSRFLETEVIAVNLDPGAERVHYDAEFDVRDLISLTEVMDEYDLGPNGAQILAADLLAAQAGEVADQLHTLSGEMMIVDTPGQVELFAFREASNHLIETLGREQSAIIYLFDPMLSRSPSGFVSQMLLSSIVEFRLGLPTKNFLSKADLLDPDDLEQILEWSERLEILELALYDEAGGQRTEFAINQLRNAGIFSSTGIDAPLFRTRGRTRRYPHLRTGLVWRHERCTGRVCSRYRARKELTAQRLEAALRWKLHGATPSCYRRCERRFRTYPQVGH